MSTIELKERLIEKIQKNTNDNILEEVYVFTEEQIEKINVARAQVEKGKYLTNDEANKEVQEVIL